MSTTKEGNTNVSQDNTNVPEDITNVTEDNTNLSEDIGNAEGNTPVAPEMPQLPQDAPEEAMPTDEECFETHLGGKLFAMYNKQTQESRDVFMKEYSAKAMAVDVELARRSMTPHEKNLRMMQSIAQQFKSKKEKKSWEHTYSNFLEKYTESEHEFHTKRDELKSTVRTFVHEQVDKAQRERIQRYKDCKPLSKGRRKHFWDALSTDNVDKLKKTLETADDVQCASYSIQHTPFTDNPKVALLGAFVTPHRSMPISGAHHALGWLLTRHRDSFSTDDIEQTKQHIASSGWGGTRVECVAVLDKALSVWYTILVPAPLDGSLIDRIFSWTSNNIYYFIK